MALRMLSAATLLGAASADINLALSDCGDASTKGHVNSLSPTTVPQGAKTRVVGKGSVDVDVTGGTFHAEVKALGVTLTTCDGDFCAAKTCDLPQGTGSITLGGLSCPQAAGDVTINFDVTVSAQIPSQLAVLELDLTAKSSSGDNLMCAKINTSPASFKDIAERVNALGTTWQAQEPTKFASVEDVTPFLGTILKGEEGYKAQAKEVTDVPNVEIPAEFDVRTAFPDCAEVSGNIRDQSSCGSCWAFGSTEAFNDRHCIATGDKTKLSVEDTTANCGFLQCFSMGCNGGQPGMAWDWFQSSGVVTGGDYFDIGSGETCAPYSLAPCAHHVPATAKYPACPSSEYPTPSLSKCSESSYGKSYSADKIKASDSYSLTGIQAIQADMVQYGSATAAFTVYDDFPTYKSGVYKRTSNNQLGGHAVKLLGWGSENGQDYWLVANSWNEQWGDHGTFKILRGVNECGIEGQVSAGRAGSTTMV